MNNIRQVELFVLKCASLKLAMAEVSPAIQASSDEFNVSKGVSAQVISQFPERTRSNAALMSEHYKLFYMLENDMRRMIDDILEEKYGKNWWGKYAPNSAKEECKNNQQREREAAVTSRSDNPLDYISFGQLGEIMRSHWDVFGGLLSNQKAMGRVMYALNVLRGPIAHCGILADDEVVRLRTTVNDWFRLLEGPK